MRSAFLCGGRPICRAYVVLDMCGDFLVVYIMRRGAFKELTASTEKNCPVHDFSKEGNVGIFICPCGGAVHIPGVH